ncbi:MAG: ATP-binding cassette domain-containing protein [Bacteroidetes bacterium]|nr:ATP-binding cassette domain-containing protein [Bacteroidota bacterium]
MRKFLTQEGFDNLFRNFPQGYESILGENGIKISGGQKQLIGLARALLRRPQVLLLDEPESYLDMDSKKFLFQKIQALRPEAIIIIASHNLQSYERLTDENTIRLNLDYQKQQT